MSQLSTSQVFMSYSRKDDAAMRRIVIFLRTQGIKVWVDNEKLIPGTPIWEEAIEKAIKNASAIVVVLSPDSKNSVWVRREISLAEQYHKYVFPVLVSGDADASIPLRLITNQFVDIRKNESAGLRSLSSAVISYLEEPEASKIDVENLANSQANSIDAQLKAKLGELLTSAKRGWSIVINFSRSITKKKFKIHPAIVSILIICVVVTGFVIYKQANNITLYFSGATLDGTNVYSYDGTNVTFVAQTTGELQSWSSSVDLLGHVFFTSKEEGKAEIYELKNDNKLQRMTNTPGKAESWSPASDPFGQLYFTSNRDGKAEIYRIKSNGQAERVTKTPGEAESWSPAIDPFGQLYFTSNRDGKAEIYRIKSNGQSERVTHTPGKTESWSSSIDPFGQLYFTSNRDGKADIYRIKSNGQIERVTKTPGQAESWSPVIRGQNIYFTSNREGLNKVYVLNPQAIAIAPFMSWTSNSVEGSLSPNP